MRRVRWDVRAGAVLLFALAYFFDGSGVVSAAVPAALAHELGHLLPLRLCRRRLRRVRVGLSGLELDYAGRLEGWRALVCIGGGPLAGLLYAVAACTLGGRFLRMSGAVSFALSAFNLLPILPLDGGRLVAALAGGALAARLSRLAAATLALAGAAACAALRAPALLLAGAWLLLCNFRPGALL
jgi:Zn-dependent protease